MTDSLLRDIIVTVLLVMVGGGFARMGVWALSGKETYLPGSGAPDGPSLVDTGPPLSKPHARWAGVAYMVAGIVALGFAVAVWI